MATETLFEVMIPTSKPLAGKVALVTGASRGIGRAIALIHQQPARPWTVDSLANEVGTSNFISFVERNAGGLAATGADPKQDDFDIWLGTVNFQPWIAYTRHSGAANYLYLDGHVVTLTWDAALPDLFPDHVVLTQDSSYPN